MTKFTNIEKQSEVAREIKWREHVYKRQIELHKMTPAQASRKIEIMREIADDYRRLAEEAEQQRKWATNIVKTREAMEAKHAAAQSGAPAQPVPATGRGTA